MDRQRASIPLPAEPLPPVCFGLLAQVKAYELLTVEAAVHGDRRAAYQALLAHPLGPAADQVEACPGRYARNPPGLFSPNSGALMG